MNICSLEHTFERIERKLSIANVIFRSYNDTYNSKNKKNQLRQFIVLLHGTILSIFIFRTLCLLFVQNDFLGDLFLSFGYGRYLLNSLFCFGSFLALSIRLILNHYELRNKSYFFWYLDILFRDLKNVDESFLDETLYQKFHSFFTKGFTIIDKLSKIHNILGHALLLGSLIMHVSSNQEIFKIESFYIIFWYFYIAFIMKKEVACLYFTLFKVASLIFYMRLRYSKLYDDLMIVSQLRRVDQKSSSYVNREFTVLSNEISKLNSEIRALSIPIVSLVVVNYILAYSVFFSSTLKSLMYISGPLFFLLFSMLILINLFLASIHNKVNISKYKLKQIIKKFVVKAHRLLSLFSSVALRCELKALIKVCLLKDAP